MGEYIHLYMYHLPSMRLAPLAMLQTRLNRKPLLQAAGTYQIDLHPHFSPDGRTVRIDSSHEGLGR